MIKINSFYYWLLGTVCFITLFPSPSLQAKTFEIPLAKIMARSEAIELHGVEDFYAISLPVSARYHVDKARLVLDFRHSNVLVPSRSQLRIRVNGITIGQYVLNPKSPRQLEVAEFAPELLTPGYNRVEFSVAQHYTDQQCEAPDSPELWTEIDSVHAKFVLESTPNILEPTLAQLEDLFDEHLLEFPLQVFMSKITGQSLQWGALATQGVALRLNYRTPQISLSPPPLRPSSETGPAGLDYAALEHDAILIGTKTQLQSLLPSQILSAIAGPYLHILAQPTHPQHFLLIISGNTEQEVTQAARAFAMLNYPFPDSSATTIHEVDLPSMARINPPLVKTGSTYFFSQLGLSTVAFNASMQPKPAEITIHLPPDFYASEHASASFSLHLAYSGGMREDSVLEVRINDVLQHTVQLNEESGAHYRDYQIVLPMRNFAPGPNRITFRPILAPLITGECTYINMDNLNVTLFGDSTLTLPGTDHYTALPDLTLFSRTGFPYSQPLDGSETAVQLLDDKPATAIAAWLILGKLAQLHHVPIWNATFSAMPAAADRHRLIFGQSNEIPKDLLKNAPIGRTPQGTRWPYALWKGYERPQQPWWRRFLSLEKTVKPKVTHHAVQMVHSGDIGKYGLVTAFQSPDHPKRLITAFLAKTPENLAKAIHQLTQPEVWGQLRGDLAVWTPKAPNLSWQQTGKAFYVGKISPTRALGYHFNRHPWQWLLAMVGILLLFAWLTHRLLARFKRRRHPDADEIAP